MLIPSFQLRSYYFPKVALPRIDVLFVRIGQPNFSKLAVQIQNFAPLPSRQFRVSNNREDLNRLNFDKQLFFRMFYLGLENEAL
jgi:hypothetical protein